MKWLWFAGPLIALGVYLLIGLGLTREEQRLKNAVRRWLDDYIGPLRIRRKKKVETRTRRVKRLAPELERMVEEAGGGIRMTDFVLLPKLAYGAARIADGVTGSNHVTIVCRLEQRAPTFTVRPVPIVDGRAEENTGLVLKDEDFMETFITESEESPKAVKKWLRSGERMALLEAPDVWLRVRGKLMALSLYRSIDEESIDELLGVADALFADHGAGGGDSLFGEDGATATAGYREKPVRVKESAADKAKKKASKKKASKEPKAPTLDLAPVATRLTAGGIDVALYTLATFLVAMTVGSFAWFHPAVFFNSPDIVVTEPWQGGWTTKGFGIFIAAEAFLVGLISYQGYLLASRGQTLGMQMLGAKVVRQNGERVHFLRGVFLRYWLFLLVPLGVAVALTQPFQARAFFLNIPTATTMGAAAGVVVVMAGSIAAGRGLHDLIAGTTVIKTTPWRLPALQLGLEEGVIDPVVLGRLRRVGLMTVGYLVISGILYAADVFPFN